MKITKAQITQRASADGVSAKTVERDYVLAHAIAAIAAHNKAGRLIFKGGTALRLIHFEDYRYSADLDFSVVNASAQDAQKLIATAIQDSSMPRMRLTDDHPPRIVYVGPLGREHTIKLDLTDDERVVHSELCRMKSRWPDVPDAEIQTYTLLEIAGEKLRCVLQRLQCRDLYDIDLLLHDAGVDPVDAAQLFHAKARHRGFIPEIFRAKYQLRIEGYKKRWLGELAEHIPGEVPPFEELERRVSRSLRKAGLL